MNVAETAVSGPSNDREDRTENQEHPCRKCQRCPNTFLEGRKEEGHYPRTYEKRQDRHADLRRGLPRGVFQISPKSRLVLHSVGKDDVALPRFNVLQPLIVLVIISHTRIRKLARIIGRGEDDWRNIAIARNIKRRPLMR